MTDRAKREMNEDIIGGHLAASLTSIASRFVDEEYSVLTKELSDLEERTINEARSANASNAMILAIKRRIATQRLYAAHYSGSNYADASYAFEKLCIIGFETLTCYVAAFRGHAAYCKRHGRSDMYEELMLDLVSFLSSIHAKDVQELLASIRCELNES
jgi:hypothetical protein